MSYKSFRDLDVYKKARKLAVEIHKMTLTLPKFEMYEEGSQIRRSSRSIRSNIVEGFGRKRYKADYIKFLTYSLSSCDETIDHIGSLFETKSLSDKNLYDHFCKEYDHLGKMLNNFIKSVDRNFKTSHQKLETSN